MTTAHSQVVCTSLSCVWLFAAPRTVTCQVRQSVENFPGKNIGAGGRSLLQEILLAQESKPHLLHWQADSLSLVPRGSEGGKFMQKRRSAGNVKGSYYRIASML